MTVMGSKPLECCCPIKYVPKERDLDLFPRALVNATSVNMLGFPSPRFPLKVLIPSPSTLVMEEQRSEGCSIPDVVVVSVGDPEDCFCSVKHTPVL